jgi:hypothetical protein
LILETQHGVPVGWARRPVNNETEKTSMRSRGKAWMTTWAVLTLGCLASPDTTHAQLGRGLGGGLGGLLGGGGGGGMGMDAGMGRRGGLPGIGGLLGNQGMPANSQPARGGLFGGYGPSSPYSNPPYNYNVGTAPSSINRVQPAPTYSNAAQGQPYLATDGRYYYPGGRPYTPPAPTAPRAATTAAATAPPRATAATAPPPATPAVNVIPDIDGSAPVASNTLRTQLPAASSLVHADLAHELDRSLAEGIERLENRLGAALFSEADEASFLAMYKRSFDENTPQYRLARKNIKYLDAGELRQGLEIDGVLDARLQVYPAKLEVRAGFDTLKRSLLDGQSSADVERAARGLVKTYEGMARGQEFDGLNLPPPDEVRAAAAALRHLFEVRQRLAGDKGGAAGGLIAMDRRFQIVRYPRLPRDTVQALDPQVCLWGSGSGSIEIQDAELTDLGVPLVNPEASPLADAARPTASTSTGVLVQNPEGNKAKVSYVIDGVSYELKPGESRPHAITAKSQIQYNRGGTLGNVHYQLSTGTYRFAIQARSWQVTKNSFSVMIDNSANGCAFQCEVDGQPRVIPAHATQQLTSAYPIAIRFDRGNGRATASKALGDAAVVTVGVAAGASALDLFSGKSQELAVRPLAVESIASQAKAAAVPAKPGRQSILPTIEDLR